MMNRRAVVRGACLALFFAAAVGGVMSAGILIAAAATSGGVWGTAAPLPEPRAAHAGVVAAGGALWVLGGPGQRPRRAVRRSGRGRRRRGFPRRCPERAVGRRARFQDLRARRFPRARPTCRADKVWVLDMRASRKWSLLGAAAPLGARRGRWWSSSAAWIHVLGGGNNCLDARRATPSTTRARAGGGRLAAPLPRSQGSPRRGPARSREDLRDRRAQRALADSATP